MLINDARRMNESSQDLYDDAVEQLEQQREATTKRLAKLGETRIDICDIKIRSFAKAFSAIKNVERTDLQLDDETIGADDLPIAELLEISLKKTDAAKALVAGAGSGGAAGMAAYVAVGALGIASTGAVIGGLSGAAAANATLAWFGGGALAAGGMGMAGGVIVLGGIIALPALLLGGFVFHQAGKRELEKAKANRAEANAVIKQIAAMSTVAAGIAQRAKQFRTVLKSLERQFDTMLDETLVLVNRETDYLKMSPVEQSRLHVATNTALTLRKAIDVPLLDNEGGLTAESGVVLRDAKRLQRELAAVPPALVAS